MSGGDSTWNTPSAARARQWQTARRLLRFDDGPCLMGIVNVTPDSFSDGGEFFSVDRAVEQGLQLVADGAGILDIGGESTRPYSEPVAVDEELRRVIPVIERLAQLTAVPLSIDTSKAAVARAACAVGAEIINDVTGLEGDARMAETARDLGAGVCVMHMRGTPQTMQDDPQYDDVVADVYRYLEARAAKCMAAGIDRARICLDPGIGFGKTHEHNWRLVESCWRFHALGFPLLVGHSRKGFIAKRVGSQEIAARDRGTAEISVELGRQGVQILRVHNVALTREFLRLEA